MMQSVDPIKLSPLTNLVWFRAKKTINSLSKAYSLTPLTPMIIQIIIKKDKNCVFKLLMITIRILWIISIMKKSWIMLIMTKIRGSGLLCSSKKKWGGPLRDVWVLFNLSGIYISRKDFLIFRVKLKVVQSLTMSLDSNPN